MKSGKEEKFVERILELYVTGMNKAEIGRKVIDEFSLEITDEAARKRVERIVRSHPGMAAKAHSVGLPAGEVKSYWYKDKNYSIQIKVPGEKGMTIEEVAERLKEAISTHAPGYAAVNHEYSKGNDYHCLVLDPSDVHIGKLSADEETGDSYDAEQAVARLFDGVASVVSSASAFNIDRVVFIGGNDILHVDGPTNATTAGTRQDVSELWWQSFSRARIAYVKIIEYLREVAPVHFMYNPSNHDYVNGYLLSQVIQAWFREAEDVTFDNSIAHRKYFRYHNNLIGTTHGDGAKSDALPLLMANEAKEYWSECSRRYFYTHHVHHKVAKDYPGVTIESIRSPSGTDSWHHKMGFQHAPKAIEGFVHHKELGQIFRITHNFNS